MIDLFENLIWFLVSFLVTGIILLSFDLKFKKLGRKKIVLISLLIGMVGFIFAPQCLCTDYSKAMLGATMFAGLFAVIANFIWLVFFGIFCFISNKIKKKQSANM